MKIGQRCLVKHNSYIIFILHSKNNKINKLININQLNSNLLFDFA